MLKVRRTYLVDQLIQLLAANCLPQRSWHPNHNEADLQAVSMSYEVVFDLCSVHIAYGNCALLLSNECWFLSIVNYDMPMKLEGDLPYFILALAPPMFHAQENTAVALNRLVNLPLRSIVPEPQYPT